MAIIKNKIFAKSKRTGNFIIVFLFILSFFLVFINKLDLVISSKIKNTGMDIFAPFSYVISYPFIKTSQLVGKVDNLKNLSLENDRLNEEIKRLKKWQILSLRLINENKAYKNLLNVSDNNFSLIHTARVINKNPSFFIDTIQINIGYDKKVSINSTVINERGLIGKIIDTGKLSSKVLLITDLNSSVPVKALTRDIQAIVSGQSNSHLLKLKFVKENEIPKIGEILVTSGNANMFPADIAVGKIYKIENKTIYAKPFVNFKKIEFVNVITNKK